MRTVLSVMMGMLVAACARTDANIYGSMVGQNVTGNEAYVTVSNVWNESDALPLADKHCGRFGKISRFKYMEANRAIFDCVAR